MADGESIQVCVVYALPDKTYECQVNLVTPATVKDAIEASGLYRDIPELTLDAGVGIYGRICSESTLLGADDRVEIYRELELDPRAARRLRAEGSLK